MIALTPATDKIIIATMNTPTISLSLPFKYYIVVSHIVVVLSTVLRAYKATIGGDFHNAIESFSKT